MQPVMYVASQIKSGWGAEMYTQRNKERRRFSGKTSFPLVTEAGCEVEKDRRCSPDRRLGNIHLELVDVDGPLLYVPDAISIGNP